MKLISMISNRRVEKLLLLCIGFVLIGCGGGGSAGNSDVVGGVPAKTMATITTENAENVLSVTLGSIDIVDVPRGLALASDNSTNIAKVSLETSKASNIASSKLKSNNIAETGTESCSGGGSLSYNGNEETGGTVIFNQCTEDGVTLNGTQILSFNGDTIHSELTNFSVKDFSSDVFISSATIDFNENTEALSMNLTGSVSMDGKKTDFENYQLSGDGNTFTISGLIQSSCVAGWMQIQTVTPIMTVDFEDCPVGGEIVVTGNNSALRTVFNSDTSIQVYLNGAIFATYANCNELPGSCN